MPDIQTLSPKTAVWIPLGMILLSGIRADAASQVTVNRTPNGGIQPQAAASADGTVHLIYFKGEPGAGDLFYTRQTADAKEFSKPWRVNSDSGSATAVGTIRGAQLAVAQGRVHVAWNGLAPKGGNYMDAPMLYTRLSDDGAGFERERNVITFARGLDGGGSLAADERGNVSVLWHAPKPGNTNGEAGRALYIARSTDQGKTFGQETLVTIEPTGACGCCGMRAFNDSQGNTFALFRGATETVNRDEILLAGRPGEDLQRIFQHSWKTSACPMSSASLAQGGQATFAAWESRDNVFFSKIINLKASPPISLSGTKRRKHPALAVNSNEEVLMVWTEGTAWGKGGKVGWQIYDRDGPPIGAPGQADGLPAWSLATAVAKPDGSFLIIY